MQKDQFLTYRRVFHGDSKDVFQKTMTTQKPVRKKQISDFAGPNPFPAVSNAATQAMAMVLNRSQQPQGKWVFQNLSESELISLSSEFIYVPVFKL